MTPPKEDPASSVEVADVEPSGADNEASKPDSGTRRNILAYYLNFAVVAAVGFVVNPLLLGAFGPVVFGVWKSLQRYLEVATVADGGASQALKWIVASRTALTDQEKRRDIGAAVIVWIRWLPVAVVLAAAITLAVPLLIRGLSEETRSLAYATAAILAANTALAGLLSIPDAVLVGVNQGYKSMLVTTLVVVASNAAMIAAAVSGSPLWWLAVIVLVAAATRAWLTRLVAKRAVPWWGVARPTAADLRRVHGYTAWTLGWVLVDKLFLACELIVISVMVGAVAVTHYTFTTYVMQFVLSIALISTSAFMPVLGSQLGAADFSAAAKRASAVRHAVLAVIVLGASAVLAFNAVFVTVWVGVEQYLGTTVNALLVVCGVQLALIRMDGQILDVTMRIGPKVVVGLISSAGGITAGCLVFATTHDLTLALVGVIVLRLASNVAYPLLVARSIAGSGIPWPPVVLAASLLAVSFVIGARLEGAEPFVAALLVAGWLVAAGVTAWAGLVPRKALRAFLIGRG